ncbi:MAG: alpha/beta hydrolase [Romboutsia sp.]
MKKKIAIISILTISILFLVVSYIVGGMVYDGSVGSKQKIENQEVLEVFSNRENKPLEVLEKYQYEDLFINSPKNGYDIEAKFIKSNIESENTVILVHGIESYYYEYLDESAEYLENGHNVVIYNQRHTGKTGGDDYTFGLYERYDLDSVAKFLKERYPNGKLGAHGYSMGAATVLMHSGINEEKKYVDFYIADSPYHEMKDAIRLGIEGENVPLIPVGYAGVVGDIYTKIKSGFSYKDVKPYEAVRNTTAPVFLIHGTADDVCQPKSSEIIYENIPHDKKEIWLIDGVKHVRGYEVLGDEYFDRIYKFIDTYVFDK